MRRLVSLLIASLAALLLAAACSSSSDSSTTQAPAPAPQAAMAPEQPAAPAAPQTMSSVPQAAVAPLPADRPTGAMTAPEPVADPSVDRLVMALQLETEANDPRYTTSIPSSIGIRPMYDNLIEIDATTGNMVPGLAESWSLEPDGASWRFQLREGVNFHKDWGTMTASDVLWSFQNRTADDATNSGAQTQKRLIGSIDVVNDFEIVISLTQTDPSFMTNNITGWEVVSKAHFDAVGSAPSLGDEAIAATGPYQFLERSQGQFIRYSRVPYDHWRVNPDFPEFEFRIISEESTRLAAILTGEAHMAEIAQDLHDQGLSVGMEVVGSQVAGQRILAALQCCYLVDDAYVHPDSPLLNPLVRKALNKAINRDELNEAFFGNKGATMYHAHVYPTQPWFSQGWIDRYPEEYGFDPAASRALLAEAGYNADNPLETIITLSSRFAGSEDVALSILSFWRGVGVEAKALTIDSTKQRNLRRNREFDNNTYVTNTSSNIFTAMNAYHSGNGARIGFEYPETSTIFSTVQQTMDEAQLLDLFQRWGNLVYDLHMDIPLFLQRAEIMVNPGVVADYVFPGTISGNWTHVEYIKSAR